MLRRALLFLTGFWIILIPFLFYKKAYYFVEQGSSDVFLRFSAYLLFFLFSAGILKTLCNHLKGLAEKKLHFLHLLALFFLLCLGLATVNLVDDYAHYTGPTLLKIDGAYKVYEGESVAYEQIALRHDEVISSFDSEEYPEEILPYFESTSLIKAVPHISFYLIKELAILLLELWLFISPGWLALKALKTKLPPLSPLFKLSLSFALGCMLVSLPLFLFAQLSILSKLSTGILIGGLSLLGLFHAKALFREILNIQSSPLKKFSFSDFLLGVFVFTVLAMNFLQVMSPNPTSFDDLSLYMDIPKMLAEAGSYLHLSVSYPIGLLQTLGEFWAPDTAITQSLIYAFGLFTLIPLFLLGIALKAKPKWVLLLLSIHLLIPTIFVHHSFQLKWIQADLFFSSMSVLAFVYWYKERLITWLGLTSLLVGFTLSIKLTNVFLAAAYFAVFLWSLFGALISIPLALLGIFVFLNFEIPFVLIPRPDHLPLAWINLGLGFAFLSALLLLWKRNTIKGGVIKNLKTSILAGALFLLPLLPWWGSNLLNNEGLSISNLLTDHQTPTLLAPMDEWGIDSASCSTTGGTTSDYEYYQRGTRDGFLGFLLTPWEMTLVTSHHNFLQNISFIFLAFIPMLFFRKPSSHAARNLAVTLIGFGALLWTLWRFFGEGVTWYGFSGWVFLLMGTLSGLMYLAKNQVTRHLTILVLIVFFLSNFFIRVALFQGQIDTNLPLYSGIVNSATMLENTSPSLQKMADLINTEPEAKVYLMDQAALKYFIENDTERVVMDHYMDLFHCFAENKRSEDFFAYLKANGVRYVVIRAPIYDLNLPAVLTLHMQEILTLANEQLDLRVGSNTDFLFEIP